MRAIGDVKPGGVALHDPMVPTRPVGDSSHAIANTAFVRRAVSGLQPPVAGAPPVNPCPGQLWWDTNDGQLYIWTGSQWVAASCCAGGGVTSVFGRTGDVIAASGDYNFSQISGILTPSQMPLFTSTTSGAVPASGDGIINFMRADGIWAAPGSNGGTTFINDNDTGTYTVDSSDDWRQFSIGANANATVIVPSSYSGKVIYLNFYFYGGSSSTITLHSDDRMFVTGYLPGVPGAAVTDIIFSGHLSVNRSFILIRQGTIWWIYNQTQAIAVTTNSSVGIQSRSLLGLVPGPPVSAPSNAALMADMTWQVPGTNTVGTSSNYTALPTDDLIIIGGSVTLTLPSSVLSGPGKILRVQLQAGAGTFTINPGPSFLRILQPTGWINYPTGYSFDVANGGELIFFNNPSTGYWSMTNRGLPLISGSYANTPGLMPAPPAGTASNAVLQADMTWRVPGTTFVSLDGAALYQATSTDDVVMWNNIPNGAIFDIPIATSYPQGKRIRLIMRNMVSGNTFTIRSAVIRPLFAAGWNGFTDITMTVTTFAGTQVEFTAGDDTWYMINSGPPMTTDRGIVPGVN